MTVRQTASEIEHEAIQWVIRQDREGPTPSIEHDIAAWLDGDIRRRGALLQAEAAWRALDASDSEASPGDVRTIGTPQPGPSRRAWLFAAGGAAIAASSAGVYLALPKPEAYRTSVGQVLDVALSDSSVMTLNTASRARVSFGAERRQVWVDEGEAWFQVAHEPSRPFVVMAGSIHVEAVGTSFSVWRRPDGAEVLMSDGVVRVWNSDAQNSVVELVRGDRVFVANDGPVKRPVPDTAAEVDRRLAWRSGRLDLDGETLGEAVSAFNRYSTVPIVVLDADTGARRLYGQFRLDDPQGFARTAAITLGTSAQIRQDRIVIGPA